MSMWATLRHAYRSLERPFIGLAALSTLAATAEGFGLILLVPIMEAALDGSSRITRQIGGIDVDLSTTQVALIAGLIILVGAFLQVVAAWYRGVLTARWHYDACLNLLHTFDAADYESQADQPEGRLITLASLHIGEGANGVRQIGFGMRGMGGVVAFLSGAALIDLAGTGIVLAVGAVLVALMRPFVARSREAATELSAVNLSVSERLAEHIEMAPDLRAFGVADRATSTFESLAARHRTARVRAMLLGGSAPIVFRTAGMLTLLAGLGLGTAYGDAPIVRMGIIAVLLYRSLSYGQLLQSSWQQLSQVTPYLEDLRKVRSALVERESQTEWSDIAQHRVPMLGEISLTDVSYRYPSEETPVLDQVSLTIRQGEVIALIGPSGSGKSTLADILLGLRAPTTGTARSGLIDLSSVPNEARAQQIARVGQDVNLWPGSVADNVRLHRPDITDGAIERSLRSIGLAELVDSPAGIFERLGPGHRQLSGGQKQRLGIARVLAGDPDLVILDEPTSALDLDNEQRVVHAVEALGSNATVIIVSHRAATIDGADRILHVDNGTVTERQTTVSRPDEGSLTASL